MIRIVDENLESKEYEKSIFCSSLNGATFLRWDQDRIFEIVNLCSDGSFCVDSSGHRIFTRDASHFAFKLSVSYKDIFSVSGVFDLYLKKKTLSNFAEGIKKIFVPKNLSLASKQLLFATVIRLFEECGVTYLLFDCNLDENRSSLCWVYPVIATEDSLFFVLLPAPSLLEIKESQTIFGSFKKEMDSPGRIPKGFFLLAFLLAFLSMSLIYSGAAGCFQNLFLAFLSCGAGIFLEILNLFLFRFVIIRCLSEDNFCRTLRHVCFVFSTFQCLAGALAFFVFVYFFKLDGSISSSPFEGRSFIVFLLAFLMFFFLPLLWNGLAKTKKTTK